MDKLINFKLTLEELKQQKVEGNISEEVYNKELKNLRQDYLKLKKKSLENDLEQEVKSYPIPINLVSLS